MLICCFPTGLYQGVGFLFVLFLCHGIKTKMSDTFFSKEVWIAGFWCVCCIPANPYTNHCRGYSTALLQTKSEFQQQQKNTSSYVNTALSFHFLVRNFLISNLGNLYCQLTFTSVRRGTNSHTRIPTVMLKGPFSTAVPAVLAQRHW